MDAREVELFPNRTLASCSTIYMRTSAYVSIRQHTSHTSAYTPAYASIRQHTPAYVSKHEHTSAYVELFPIARRRLAPLYICIRQHTSAYVSIRLHTSAYVSKHEHTWHSSVDVSRRRALCNCAQRVDASAFLSTEV
jgi:hypothetical protein